ncbi:class I SAM-dependent methyltransferase [Roseiconus nitratireducens]|uniref:Class I SAM-dependent methyltransferase n=1 Tax=Roseiconus nitratireducens TaxID=2605748 RepID=A0A5M6CJN0_9BACT|nr:class I SAM-dependent methyltransferase [Roseiconus nitratireducens]KAA5535421.1 class I SAM-dependent methyltransferase [Roseiconus nitratireducens]
MRHFYSEIPGWFTFSRFYREAIASAPEPARFVEIGVWKGRSTAFLGVEILNSAKRIRLDVVDTFQGSDELVHQQDADLGRLEQAFRRNIEPVAAVIGTIRSEPSTDAALHYRDRSLDFVFIDAAHDYESVKRDIQAWKPKIKRDGILAGHDYHPEWPGVVRAVDELCPTRTVLRKQECWVVY